MPFRNNIRVIRYWLHLPGKYRICYTDNTNTDHPGSENYVHGLILARFIIMISFSIILRVMACPTPGLVS